MFARCANRFAPVAAVPVMLHGSVTDTSAHLSNRISCNLHRSAARYLSTSSEPGTKKATRQASTAVLTTAEDASKRTFFAWYESHLQTSPVKTKMVTGSFLWGLGDAVAQFSSGAKEYDFPRTGRAVFFGFAIHAPSSHVHFNFLEWMTVRSGVTGLGIPVFKTVMEQVSC